MLFALRTLEWSGFPRYAALLVAALGLTVLVGWALDVTLIKNLLPGTVAMKANTALCFLLAGCALFLHLQTPGWQRLVQGMALVVATIGIATLGEYLFDWQLGIDQLLFREPVGAVYTLYLGRMSVYTASGFAAAGFALLALSRQTLRLPTQLAAALALLVGVVPLLGYLGNISSLDTASDTTPMAVTTSLGLILLGVALLVASLTSNRATPPL